MRCAGCKKVGSVNDAVPFTGGSRIGARFLFSGTSCGLFSRSLFFLLGLVGQCTRSSDRLRMSSILWRQYLFNGFVKSRAPSFGDEPVEADRSRCGAKQLQRGKATIGIGSEPGIDLSNLIVGYLPIGGDGLEKGHQFSDDPNRLFEGHYRMAMS
jgi:hypothetical protein